MKRHFFSLCSVFSLVGLIVMTSAGFAQQADEESFTLEEVTVTAQKREENQQKVAIAMDTVAGEDMKAMGSNNLDKILSNISSVILNRAQDGIRVSIRGMSDDVTPAGSMSTFSSSTPSVAVNTDGIFSTKRSSGGGLYDLERVEVLYGPQSTLYASNSPGGIVNIVTANPRLGIYAASGTMEYGSYNALHTEGMINAPVSSTVALRGAFSTSVHDGYMSNGTDDEDSKSARLRLLYQPKETLSFTVTGEYQVTGGAGFSSVDLFKKESDLPDPWQSAEDAMDPSPRLNTTKKLSANVNWQSGMGSLTIVPAWSETSMDATSPVEDFFTGAENMTHMTQSGTEKGIEARMTSSADAFAVWIIGVNYYKSEQEDHQMPESGFYQNMANWEETQAVFGNITYPVMETFRVTGGLRYSKDETYTERDMLMQNPMTGLPDVVFDPSLSDYNAPDWKLGVEYDLNENSMLYANWSTSFRTMGMTLKAAEPEKLNAYTLGAKNRLFDNKFQVNASGYYYDYQSFLADAGMSDPMTGRMDSGSQGDGDLREYGFDLQTQTIVTENDKLDFSVSYLNSEFTRLYFDFVSPILLDEDYAGRPKTFSPEWTFSGAYSHIFNLGEAGTLTARLDSRYQSSYLVSYLQHYTTAGGAIGVMGEVLSLEGYNEQEAHQISNFSLIYGHADGKWTLTGYVKNMEDYCEKRNLMMRSLMIGSPRTYGAVLAVKY